ncbi:hypothetical protein ACWEFJ_38565 [Actinosynnema sp. NPDC004786]
MTTADTPAEGPPTADLPTADLPTADLPTADLPTADLPTADLPTADEPSAEGPTAEGPTAAGTDEPTAAAPAVAAGAGSTAADALAAAYRHGPGRLVTDGPTPEPRPFGPGVALGELARHGAFGAALAHLLADVATPQRWEPWNPYNDHRAYPSARSTFAVDVALVADGRSWPLDPVRRALVGGVPERLGTSVRLDLVRRPERFSAGYGEFADVLVELEAGHLSAALEDHARRLGLRAGIDGDGLVVSSHRETGRPVPHTSARSSGYGPRGFSADPRPLPASALHAVVAAVPRLRHLRHRLAVHNVEGVPDGWHGDAGASPVMARIADTFRHPPSVLDVGSANLALVLTGDPAAAVAEAGPDGYRALLRAAGAVAQRVGEAAAGAGLFCRPLRSLHDEHLEALAGAPAGHTLLYLLVAGRPRATGFTYDLTPLEARP